MWRLFLILYPLVVLSARNHVKELDWWETAVFYQIPVRSFMDSDGDGIGDLNGVSARMEYLKELGINAICLLPIFKSMKYDFGFDVTDYYNIDPEYGSADDFSKLLSKAKELEIKVILDIVPNHTSAHHDWFKKSVAGDEYYSDWYIWEDQLLNERAEKMPPNNWLSLWGNSSWEFSPHKSQYYLHQFSAQQPDLNYRNPVVVEEIKRILRFWLEKGVSGFRMSSVNHLFEADKELYGNRFPDEPEAGLSELKKTDYGYLKHVHTKNQEESYDMVYQWREVLDHYNLAGNLTRVLIVEADTTVKNLVRYYGKSSKPGAHIPINMALMDDLKKNLDARDLKYIVDRWFTYKPPKMSCSWMTGNHNKKRVASRFRPELVDVFNALILLLPGAAFTYMGEEIGMEDTFLPWTLTVDHLACANADPMNYNDISRDPVRTPFHWSPEFQGGFSTSVRTWLPVSDNIAKINVAYQKSAPRSNVQVYSTLTTLRKRPAFHYGHYTSIAINKDVFAFKRYFNDEAFVVAMNIGKLDHVVDITVFELVSGQVEIVANSVLSSKRYGDTFSADSIDLFANELLVLKV